ncbi:amino acid permease [Actinomadura madurae]|uniref:APC family permease n=1 Tax=Actinomadura madurae TaxID=1993 RepID=UPI00202609CE|nr:amino acid permease [Actinomadura madurae]URN02373.1 amino acid permease [Actinomadura madurae]
MTLDMRMRNNMFRRLPVEQATGRLYGGRHRLRVVYRTRDLVVLGLGVMIGSGIFKIAGEQASSTAGPGVLVSFLIAGGVCVLAALAFAELSSIVPVAGSAYSFSYVAFGEVWAWVVGWALIMELLLAASVLARVWSLYAAQALQDFGVGVPSWLGELIGQQKGPDLFALGILLLVVLMLATGSRMSLKSLWFMVMAKVIVIGLVIATALKFFSPGNLTPFLPPSQPAPEADQTVLDAVLGALGGGTPHVFGVWGMFAAAPAIAFAYIGFDLIATASEETDDAPRKVPRGILTALVTTIVLYAAVAVALVGMVGMDGIANLNPDKLLLAAAFDSVGAGAMGKIVDVGAMLALTTVILVLMISLTRVVFSISRDGLLPRPLAAMSRYKVPSRATLLAGGAAVVMSQTIDVLTLEQLVVIGSLFAFLFVAAAVLALRRSRPDLHRPFRMPAAPLVVIVTIFAIGWLMLNLNVETWAYFAIWMIVGIGIYLVYGRRKSQMKLLLDAPPPARPVAAPMAPAPPPGAALPRARRRRPRARCRGRGTCAPPPGRSARGRGRARGAPARRRAPTPPAGTRRDAGRAAGSRPSPTPPTRPRRAGHRAAARPGRTPPGRPRIRTRSIRACRTRTRPGPTSPGRTDPNPPGRTNPGPMNPGPRNPDRTSPGPTSPAPTSRAARSRTPAGPGRTVPGTVRATSPRSRRRGPAPPLRRYRPTPVL